MGSRDLPRIGRVVAVHLPWVALDGALAIIAFAIALLLRFGGRVPPHNVDTFLTVAPWIGSTYCLSAMAFGLYKREWDYASLVNLTHLSGAIALASTLLLVVDALAFGLAHPMPLSCVPIGGGITFFALAATKLGPPMRRFLARRLFSPGGIGVLIVGAGPTGELLARETLRNSAWNYRTVCFVDADPRKRGRRIDGVPVRGGIADIPWLVRRYNASAVVITTSSASASQMRAVAAVCQPLRVRLLVVPGMPELRRGEGTPVVLREMRIEDLLGQEQVRSDLDVGRSYLAGRRVLITGAAGSIGSELSRQVLALGPSALVLFDNNESGVADLALSLRIDAGSTVVEPCVGSVTNHLKVMAAFRRWRPDVVFHAAAYKDASLMEDFPEEAVVVNVLGTRAVGLAAKEHGVERFVLVSSDKAASPTSVLGATMRLAEQVVTDLAAGSDTVFCAVRTGSLLGSRGSVVAVFAQQIERGGPITVTQEDVTGRFTTMPEAASLIVEAGGFAGSGEVLLLDAGERIRIVDLAEKMAWLRGKRLGVDIEMVFTGPRPGEEQSDGLVDRTEDVRPTRHPRVLRLDGTKCAPTDVSEVVSRLAALVVQGATRELRAALLEAADEDPPLEARPSRAEGARPPASR